MLFYKKEKNILLFDFYVVSSAGVFSRNLLIKMKLWFWQDHKRVIK